VSALTPSLDQVSSKISELDVDDWLGLWCASQGGEARARRFAQIAAVLPLDPHAGARILDLCSGPGDLGRAVHQRFPLATIDCVDADPVLLGLCRALNLRAGVAGRTLQRDLWRSDWIRGIGEGYDAACVAAALHWFDRDRFSEVLVELHALLRPGGFVAISEPISTHPIFRETLGAWERECGSSWDPAAWDEFLERSRRQFAHAPVQPETSPGGEPVIGDAGMPVREYLDRLDAAGFVASDVIACEGGMATFVAQRVHSEQV